MACFSQFTAPDIIFVENMACTNIRISEGSEISRFLFFLITFFVLIKVLFTQEKLLKHSMSFYFFFKLAKQLLSKNQTIIMRFLPSSHYIRLVSDVFGKHSSDCPSDTWRAFAIAFIDILESLLIIF